MLFRSIEKFKERANALKMPDGVRKVFDEELNKLMHLEPAASEANVTRNYLDWLTQVCNSSDLKFEQHTDRILVDPLGCSLQRELLDRTCRESIR